MLITKKINFEAAHRLIDATGKLENVHGHTWTLEVTLKGNVNAHGIVYDFVELERVVKELVLSKLDHTDLNKILVNPSAENVAIWVWSALSQLPLYKIRIWESQTAYVTYFGDHKEQEEIEE